MGERVHLNFPDSMDTKIIKLKLLSGCDKLEDVIKFALASYEVLLENQHNTYVKIYDKYIKITVPVKPIVEENNTEEPAQENVVDFTIFGKGKRSIE